MFCFNQDQNYCLYIAQFSNRTAQSGRQRGRDDPPFVPTQQFKLHRFCFFGQGPRLWESKLRLTFQVRPVWDMGKDPVIQGAAMLWDLIGSYFKRREEGSLVSGILFPRQWAAFLTLKELVKHHGRFPLLWSENQDRNLMLPPLILWRGRKAA